MRTFDYLHLPQKLFSGTVGDANVRLYEDKGKFEQLKATRAAELDALREQARFDNVEASAHIEGLYPQAGRAQAVLAGSEPTDEVESQLLGYSSALKLVEGDADALESVVGFGGGSSARGSGDDAGAAATGSPTQLDLSTSSILALYERLYAHRNLGRKSRYRKKDYIYVQVDGHPQAMPVSPITAFETPLVLGGACDSLAKAFDAQACSPLILSAVFTVDFLCIRPFDEGNGRISRLFADLMLMKAGFDVARYASIDRIIEGSAMDYYDALNACVEGWDRGRNDYEPFARYWLEVVHHAYEQVFEKLNGGTGGKLKKSERVALALQHADRPLSKRDIRAELPDVSEATVEAALGALVRDGAVEKLGAGRATTYRWLG